jgi:5-formyltetrahydrofolate cyclo-ligase
MLDALFGTLMTHPSVVQARTLFVYISRADEAPTHAFIDTLVDARRQVLVPVIERTQGMHAVAFPGWAALRPGALGILTPPPAEVWGGSIDCVVVPLVGFTSAGARLGYGGGYYDRWLARHAAVPALGLAFACQRVDTLPHSSHDIPLASIVTEEGIVWAHNAAPA